MKTLAIQKKKEELEKEKGRDWNEDEQRDD